MGRTNTKRWSALVLFTTLAFVGVALSGCMHGDEEDRDGDQVTPEEDTQGQQEQGTLMLFLRDSGEERGEGQTGTSDQNTTGGQQSGQQQDGLQDQGQQTQQTQQQDQQSQDGQTFQQQQTELESIELSISQVTVQGGGQGEVGAESDLGDDGQTGQDATGQQNDTQTGQDAQDPQATDTQQGQDAQGPQATDMQQGQDTNSQIGQETDPVTPETDDAFGDGTGSTGDTGDQQGASGHDLLDEQTQVTFGGGGDDEFVVQSEMASGTYDNITIQVSEIRAETEEGCELVFTTDGLEIDIEGSFQVDSDSTTQVLAEIDVTQAILSSRAIAENCPQEQDGGLVEEVTPQEEQRVDDAELRIETVQVLVATDVSLFHESTNTFDEDAAESQGETGFQGDQQNQTDARTRDDQTVTP